MNESKRPDSRSLTAYLALEAAVEACEDSTQIRYQDLAERLRGDMDWLSAVLTAEDRKYLANRKILGESA